VITRLWIVSLAALLIGSISATAQAQFDHSGRSGGGITVSGIGMAKGLPDTAKIEIHMQGKAEITDDALVKYHATYQRLTEALEKLKLENLRVSEHGVKLSSGGGNANMQMMMMNGMGGQGGEAAPTEMSGTLRVELTNLQNMPKDEVWKVIGKVLDAIRDAGGAIGPSAAEMNMGRWYGMMQGNTAVKFVLTDLKPLREQSYELAVADARARGDRLARLSGIKLAGVAAVQEVQIAGDSPEFDSPNPYWQFNMGNRSQHDRDQIVVESLTEIPVTVRLMVRFEIADGAAKPEAGTKPAEVSSKDVTIPQVSTQ